LIGLRIFSAFLTGIIVANGLPLVPAGRGMQISSTLLSYSFAVLLVGGLLGFAFGLVGFAAMVAYLVAGPDGMTYARPRMPAQPSNPPTLAPTS